jgi:25S rRNA (cytosine2870-C5)-methyltransferase
VAYALSRRPNVKLVDTELPFGKEGFTSYMGKKFDSSLRLTRRYYPHTHNVDGFFVAKFKKTGPTPANAVSGSTQRNGNGSVPSRNMEVVDNAPISAVDIADEMESDSKNDFGDFDEDEDKKYIERAQKNAMRRRGLDPRVLKQPKNKQSK